MIASTHPFHSWLCIIILTALVGTSVTLHAQNTTGDPQIVAIDSTGAPIPDANVTIAGAGVQGTRGASTDRNGRCVILALPMSWKGTLIQHAGRLHRTHPGKKEVQIYDYVDRSVPVLKRMFERRVRGYRAIGYKLVDGSKKFKDGNTDTIDIFPNSGTSSENDQG